MSDENVVGTVGISEETLELLRCVPQDRANALMMAFADACRSIQATTPEIMWTIAMLEARVIATYQIGEPQQRAASQFSELLAAALPAAILALEHAKLAMSGGKPT